jgi:hypothetical protein
MNSLHCGREGTPMSKGQHGNKEAKKPKQDRSVAKPLVPGAVVPAAAAAVLAVPPRKR